MTRDVRIQPPGTLATIEVEGTHVTFMVDEPVILKHLKGRTLSLVKGKVFVQEAHRMEPVPVEQFIWELYATERCRHTVRFRDGNPANLRITNLTID